MLKDINSILAKLKLSEYRKYWRVWKGLDYKDDVK